MVILNTFWPIRDSHWCYVSDGAFLRNSDFVQAMLICLRAVELNKVAVLADIDPKIVSGNFELFLFGWT